MTELDREIRAAIDALVHRLKNRTEGTDDEPFAMEFVQAMIDDGWLVISGRLIMGLPERFWAKCVVDDAGYETPCLTWVAEKSDDGYGRFRWLGRKYQAHRAAYQQMVDLIPAGLTLDHLCRNPACVNIQHLEPVTNRENILRGGGPAALNARKTYCGNGHEYTPENTLREANGKRHCRTCRRDQNREYMRRKRAAAITEGVS